MLPYLEIEKDNENIEEKQEVEVPNLIGMTIKEAKQVLLELGLEIEVKENLEENDENNDAEKQIIQQLPKAGISIKQGVSIIVYEN